MAWFICMYKCMYYDSMVSKWINYFPKSGGRTHLLLFRTLQKTEAQHKLTVKRWLFFFFSKKFHSYEGFNWVESINICVSFQIMSIQKHKAHGGWGVNVLLVDVGSPLWSILRRYELTRNTIKKKNKKWNAKFTFIYKL